MTTPVKPTNIVILGGGFAGIGTARALLRSRSTVRRVQVHLVNDENYFVFQPLLPEVVACGIEPTHIVNPIRQLCPRARFHCAAVDAIDPAARTVSLIGADPRRILTLSYDHLVIALGLSLDVSRFPGMTEHSLPIRTLGDAFHLRNHILTRLEQADIEPDENERRKALTVVAVGGGFSGVETVAEINDMIKAVLRYYPRARATGHRVVLVHSRDRILNELSESLGRFAQRRLARRGVELVLRARVKEATAEGIVLDDGRVIPAGTIICTVGNAPHPVLSKSALPRDKGRILVDERLAVRGHSNIWAIGDSALIPDLRRGGYCPPTAQYATREGSHCARNILSTLAGREPAPFAFGGLGQMAAIGHRSGVAEILGVRVAGAAAWFLWRSVYFMKLPGLRAKTRVGIDWALDLLFPRDITKLAMDRTNQIRRAHYRPGDVIIRQGELGDRFYVIESGQVEVVRTEEGQAEQQLAIRRAGESFGEIALLKSVPRTATVRCLTPVDVLSFTRKDFLALAGTYEVLRARIAADVEERSAATSDRDGEERATHNDATGPSPSSVPESKRP